MPNEFSNVAFERFAVTRIVFVNIDFRESAQVIEADWQLHWNQPAIGRDDEGATKGIGVSELAAKVESAQKSENFA